MDLYLVDRIEGGVVVLVRSSGAGTTRSRANQGITPVFSFALISPPSHMLPLSRLVLNIANEYRGEKTGYRAELCDHAYGGEKLDILLACRNRLI